MIYYGIIYSFQAYSFDRAYLIIREPITRFPHVQTAIHTFSIHLPPEVVRIIFVRVYLLKKGLNPR